MRKFFIFYLFILLRNEKIFLYEGDCVEKVAIRFCKKFGLTQKKQDTLINNLRNHIKTHNL